MYIVCIYIYIYIYIYILYVQLIYSCDYPITQNFIIIYFNTLNAEFNPMCHLLVLLEGHHILHVSRMRVKPH